jgi:hypothetical protein
MAPPLLFSFPLMPAVLIIIIFFSSFFDFIPHRN